MAKEKMKDYYAVLGLSRQATPEEIEEAYLRLATESQPHMHPDEDPKVWEAAWKEILQAGGVLRNETAKKNYDKLLRENEKEENNSREIEEEIEEQVVDSAEETGLIPVDIDDKEKKGKKKRWFRKRGFKIIDLDKSEEAKKKADKARRHLSRKTITVIVTLVLIGTTVCTLHSCHKAQKVNNTKEINKENDADDISVTEETLTEETLIEIEDPYIETPVYAFTDAFDDEQVHNRAMAIHEYFERSNLHNISVEEIETAIKYINCAYIVDENKNASVEISNAEETTFKIFAAYGTSISQQPANFAGGVVDENGVQVALGYDAFVTDDTQNAAFLKEASMLFQNVMTSQNHDDKVEASKQMLKQEADMMAWLVVDETDTSLSFANLNSTEGFIYGFMVQAAAPVIKSALGEDYAITYSDNVGNNVNLGISAVESYYNANCDGEGWTVWNNHLNNINGYLRNINDTGEYLYKYQWRY